MKILAQIALIFGVCLIGEGIARFLPLPGSVVSMVLLFLLLLCRVVKPAQVEGTADFLLRNMAFFFIPSFVETMEHGALLLSQALPLLVIVGLTTPLIYLVTGWTVQLIMLRRRKGGKPHD